MIIEGYILEKNYILNEIIQTCIIFIQNYSTVYQDCNISNICDSQSSSLLYVYTIRNIFLDNYQCVYTFIEPVLTLIAKMIKWFQTCKFKQTLKIVINVSVKVLCLKKVDCI